MNIQLLNDAVSNLSNTINNLNMCLVIKIKNTKCRIEKN